MQTGAEKPKAPCTPIRAETHRIFCSKKISANFCLLIFGFDDI
jgi:hypothetical protein